MKYFTLIAYTDGDELLDAEIVKAETPGEMAEKVRELKKIATEDTDGNVMPRAYSISRLIKSTQFRRQG